MWQEENAAEADDQDDEDVSKAAGHRRLMFISDF
jgi:hypothetical protein